MFVSFRTANSLAYSPVDRSVGVGLAGRVQVIETNPLCVSCNSKNSPHFPGDKRGMARLQSGGGIRPANPGHGTNEPLFPYRVISTGEFWEDGDIAPG